LHSGNIFLYAINSSVIGDLGLCQQVVDNNPNKIYGVNESIQQAYSLTITEGKRISF
jgi:hypothetical protein